MYTYNIGEKVYYVLARIFVDNDIPEMRSGEIVAKYNHGYYGLTDEAGWVHETRIYLSKCAAEASVRKLLHLRIDEHRKQIKNCQELIRVYSPHLKPEMST